MNDIPVENTIASMRLAEVLGIDMRLAAAFACTLLACVRYWQTHPGAPNILVLYAANFCLGCVSGLYACWREMALVDERYVAHNPSPVPQRVSR